MNKRYLFLTSFILINLVKAGPASGLIPDATAPEIIAQPQDQLVPEGADATFTVRAQDAIACQWFRNGIALDGATNLTLTIKRAGIADVGRYSCNLANQIEPDSNQISTRPASLLVFTTGTDPKTGLDPIVVFSLPVNTSGSQGTCPGSYLGYAYYSKQSGWGWSPTSGDTVFTASDTNRSNTKVEFIGNHGDSGCNQTTVSIPNPPTSPLYQFAIYFTNNVPTNAYGITLTGFNP